MIKRLKTFSFLPVLLLLAILLSVSSAFAQNEGYKVLRSSVLDGVSPIEIVSVKVKGSPVQPQQIFTAGDDWLND